MKNILSVDVEEWFHPEALQHLFPSDGWDKQEERVEGNVDMLLDLFARKQARATFFILGWVASRHPEMVRRISDAGHEIASHGNRHRMLTRLTPESFKSDLAESKKILQDLSGSPVIGFRAPTFSMVKDTFWAWDILLEMGFRYDSSVYPIWHDRYGVPDAPRAKYTALEKNGKKLIEFSMPTIKIAGKNFPFGGGGYLRIFPLWFTRYAIKKFNKEGYPAIIYMHPWEFDRTQPRLKLGFLQSRRHYYNIGKNYDKLTKLLDYGEWISFKDFLEDEKA